MSFCTNCGQDLSPKDRVCPNCGTPVRPSMQSAGQVKKAQNNQKNTAPQYSKKKQGISPAVIIALILVAAIAAGTGIVLTNRNKNNTNSSDMDQTKVVSIAESSEDSAAASDASKADAEKTPAPTEKPISNVTYYVTGVADKIHLFEKENSNSLITGDLKNGDTMKLLDDSGSTYWKVLTDQDSLSGYIDKHYITDDKSAVTEPKTVYANVQNSMTLYKEPKETSEQLGKLKNGDSATIIAETKGDYWFAYADSLKQYGYLKKQYLSPNKPTPTPTPTPKPTPTAAPTPEPTQPPALTEEPAQNEYFGPGDAPSSYTTYYAAVDSGYLALRNAKAFDASNEIGKVQNGQAVYVIETPNETYWYVFVPSLGMWGYVNSDYLTSSGGGSPSTSTTTYTVKVDSGYLALRTAPAFDASNEIGALYTGDKVEVSDSSGTYWWVYSPKYGAWGYVNGNYLHK